MTGDTSRAVRCCAVPGRSGQLVASAVYRSGLRSASPRRPPFSAWPEIAAKREWLSFPTLLRAVYLHNFVVTKPDFGQAAAYVEERRETFGQDTIEQALAVLGSGSPIALTEEVGDLVARSMDWVIAHSVALGRRDAFGLVHELVHWLVGARGIYSAVVQATHADGVHELLQAIAMEPSVAPDIWTQFEEKNGRLLATVERFRPIEEAVANYIGLRLMDESLRQSIVDDVQVAMQREQLLEVFQIVDDACTGEDELGRPLILMQLATVMADYCHLTPLHAVAAAAQALGYRKTGTRQRRSRHREQLGAVVDWFFEAAQGDMVPTLVPLSPAATGAYWDDTFSQPVVLLWDTGGVVDIDVLFDETLTTMVKVKAFWESLRQQIHLRTGLGCPYRGGTETCCGLGHLLARVWTRLPDEIRQRLIAPSPVCLTA